MIWIIAVVVVLFLYLCILHVGGQVFELRQQIKRLEARVTALDDPLRSCTPLEMAKRQYPAQDWSSQRRSDPELERVAAAMRDKIGMTDGQSWPKDDTQ